MAVVGVGIRADGSLEPGTYEYGTYPIVTWTKEDTIRVEMWLADKAGIHISNVKHMEVSEVGSDRLMAEMIVLHRSAQGHHHLCGHCNDEPNALAVRGGDVYGTTVEIYCEGCGRHLGKVSRSLPREDYVRHLSDQHMDACYSTVRFEYPR